ncbi:Flavin carrier protein 2 [Elsinoe australis]|uniref:Flavin carrier protein 2 n=1 Tax=Elsinoe australis TaxID=40998 RepID=A0A2P7YC74_9PEZI|nr:Flavin carrier protein 2 [Elsinoe australis]
MGIMALLSLLLLPAVFAQNMQTTNGIRYVSITDSTTNQQVLVPDDRKPALYTGNFGDCLGSSLINVTRFDASYYADNMTIMFHLAGTTALQQESLMMYIGVYAYGESRFDLIFNPCSANIASLCPARSNTTIEANGLIPVSQSDVAGIPNIALSIPDFEGQAILRIFSNSTQSEIGCYSAVVTNGSSFSQPASVGTILGLLTLVAIIASFAAAMYGDSIPVMRNHYAHSLSVGVVFSVFQHIFFTGALSMNWPSVLVAFWSNFAWSAGMINTASMQNSINRLVGNDLGNTSQVGAAGSGTTQTNLGGGFDLATLYKRGANEWITRDLTYDIFSDDPLTLLKRQTVGYQFEQALQKRALVNSTTGYSWYGQPVPEGLPLPGNYSGFAGTLGQQSIRASNAFMTGFLWLIVLLILVAASVIAFKWALEGLIRSRVLKEDRLALFRSNWIAFTIAATLRTCFIAFFMIMFLTMFQFTYQSSAGPKAIAAIVFIVFFVGTIMVLGYAYYYRFKTITMKSNDHEMANIPTTKLKRVSASLQSLIHKDASGRSKFFPVAIFHVLSDLGREPHSIHEDEDYVKKFGWLAARFRRSRWWFFGTWSIYEFIRACFYAGASGHPKTQVFGLLVVEIAAFALFIWARPFEGQRLNVLVVYLLGFSKVTSVALSAAFDVSFNLPRILATVIGIIIIVIQGLLTIVTVVAILVGAASTWMSIRRNVPKDEFKPKKWRNLRERYFAHIERTAREMPRPVKEKPQPMKTPPLPNGPYFQVSSVRRMNKIEDEDRDFAAEMRLDPSASYLSLDSRNFSPASRKFSPMGEASPNGPTRAVSAASSVAIRSNLPRGARGHRPSWSIHEPTDDDRVITPVNMNQSVPEDNTLKSPITTSSTPNFSRLPSRAGLVSGLSIPKLRGVRSMDTVRSADLIRSESPVQDVPAPKVRPRSGTWASSRGPSQGPSRNATPSGSVFNMDRNSTGTAPPEDGPAPPISPIKFPRPLSMGNALMAPAEEKDEELAQQNSRQ